MSLTDGDLPTLEKRRETLLAYLRDKVESEDFHGVADCAMDLREVDAAIQVVKRHDIPTPVLKSFILAQFRALANNPDKEYAHSEADDLLLNYLGDKDITAAFKAIGGWYA